MITPVQRILWATDLAQASAGAGSLAVALARHFGAGVVVACLGGPGAAPATPPGGAPAAARPRRGADAQTRPAAADDLARLWRRLGGMGLSVRTRWEGADPDRILEAVREERADLVVVGTDRRAGDGPAGLDPLAERVVRHAGAPVLVVPAGGPGGPPAPPGRIAYPTDFSPAARAAWPWVLRLAGAAGARVDLLHVVTPPVPTSYLGPGSLGRMAELLRVRAEAVAAEFLAGAAPSPEWIDVSVTIGDASEEILAQARARSADLLVMGAVGLSSLTRWTLGAVAGQVLRTAACPVLTVRPAYPANAEPAPSGTDRDG